MSDTNPKTTTHPVFAAGHMNEFGRFVPDVVSVIRVMTDDETTDGTILSTTIATSADIIDGHDVIDFQLTDTIGDLLDRLALSPSEILRRLVGAE